MKKILAILLICMAAAGAGVSCGSSNSSSESAAVSGTEQSSASAIEEGKKIAEERMRETLKEIPTIQQSTLPDKPASVSCDPEAEQALKECIECMYTSDAAETLKYFYPKSMYDGLISGGIEENFKKSGVSGTVVSDFSIDRCELLSANPWLGTIKQYFTRTAENYSVETVVPVMVSKSYETDISFSVTEGGNTEKANVTVIVTYVSGDGWKVIPLSCDQLSEAIENLE